MRSPHSVAQRLIRVALVDDHPLIREGLDHLFAETEDIALVGYAPDGEQAVRMCGEVDPDVVLVDVRLPGIDGIEAARRILARFSRIRVLILTSIPTLTLRRRAHGVGALQLLVKDDPAHVMLAAIRSAAAS